MGKFISCRERTFAFSREHMVAVLYILMCAYFFVSGSEPAEPFVKQVLLFVQCFGLLAVFLVLFTRGITIPEYECIFCLLKGMTFYLMALWLIGNGGDAFYGLALAYPDGVAAGVIAFIIVWIIVWIVVGMVGSPKGIPGAAAITEFKKPTERDNRYLAAHEAGHALVYAALGRLPPDVKAVLSAVPDHNGVLGFVTGINSQRYLDEKTFVEWNMLVLLAGKMGEVRMLGESTQLSRCDHAYWLDMARSYLSSHNQGIFYPVPRNEFEQKSNEEKLSALQASQLSMLSQLFDLNTNVFRELADTLLKKRILLCGELIPFLAKVKFSDGFPRPDGD